MTSEDQSKHNVSMLRDAAIRGDVGRLKEFIPQSNITSNTNALVWAAQRGNADCVELLIPVSNPLWENSEALNRAAMYGHTECVRLLIPVSEPKAGNSYALQCASIRSHRDVVELLIPVSDAYTAKTILRSLYCHQAATFIDNAVNAMASLKD